MSHPIVFLDFDGVLNSLQSNLALGTWRTFDPVSVRLIERLVRLADARIVVSSSWRIGRSFEQLMEDMTRAGAGRLVPFVLSMTSSTERKERRGEEIALWLQRKPHRDRYVIIDDDSDMLPEQPFVHTSVARGFGLCEYVAALDHLLPGSEEARELRAYVGLPKRGMRLMAGHYDA